MTLDLVSSRSLLLLVDQAMSVAGSYMDFDEA